MAETYQLKHTGEQIDALLDKAGTAVQPTDIPADIATQRELSDLAQTTDAKLTELSEETSARFERSAESVAERFEVVDTEIEQLKRGEAYVFGETLAFRNFADAMVQGNTLTL